MKLYLIIVFLICDIISIEENDIIKIPNKEGIHKNIKTKNGPINFGFYYRDDFCSILYIKYIIEGIKNLNVLKLQGKPLISKFNIYENENLEMIYYNEERDKFSPLICEIFYKTKYIDKMIYSIGKDEDNESYKFFGGTPLNLIQNLNKFNFHKNTDKIQEIKIQFYNGTNYVIDKFDNELIEFREDEYSLLCLPENILNKFRNLFLKDFEETIYNYKIFNSLTTYKINKHLKYLFPNISFTIGNKIFNLNKENAFSTKYDLDDDYFFIIRTPCDKLIFGLKFLELFNFREFNLETGEISLYLDKYSNVMLEKEENKKTILNSSICFIIIFISIFFVSLILTKAKNYYKNKKIEYYNYYYN